MSVAEWSAFSASSHVTWRSGDTARRRLSWPSLKGMVTSTFGIALTGPLTLPSPPMGARASNERDSRERDSGEPDHARDQGALLSLRGGGVAPKAPVDLDVAEESRGILVEVEEGISPAIEDAAA